jgi:hypothetical protein
MKSIYFRYKSNSLARLEGPRSLQSPWLGLASIQGNAAPDQESPLVLISLFENITYPEKK